MSHYVPHTSAETRAMLGELGLSSVDALFTDVPKQVRLTAPVPLPKGLSQMETQQAMEALAARKHPIALRFAARAVMTLHPPAGKADRGQGRICYRLYALPGGDVTGDFTEHL